VSLEPTHSDTGPLLDAEVNRERYRGISLQTGYPEFVTPHDVRVLPKSRDS
jgi:hypothetical protein